MKTGRSGRTLCLVGYLQFGVVVVVVAAAAAVVVFVFAVLENVTVHNVATCTGTPGNNLLSSHCTLNHGRIYIVLYTV